MPCLAPVTTRGRNTAPTAHRACALVLRRWTAIKYEAVTLVVAGTTIAITWVFLGYAEVRWQQASRTVLTIQSRLPRWKPFFVCSSTQPAAGRRSWTGSTFRCLAFAGAHHRVLVQPNASAHGRCFFYASITGSPRIDGKRARMRVLTATRRARLCVRQGRAAKPSARAKVSRAPERVL
eukprot:3717160-Pleurochrysis_carterae.AAC.1